jgi:CRP/FNR family transcriptional regulator, cyclic AMP receptor protein
VPHNQKTPDLVALLKTSPVFASLPEPHLRELAGKARIETYADRTLLCQRGEYPEYIRYVVSGGIDMVLSTPDGGYSSLPIFQGRWSSWLGCMGAEPLVHDMWSTAPASYLALPCRDVQKAVADQPAAMRLVIEEIGVLTRFLTGCVLSFAAYGPEKRIVYLLLLASSEACSLTEEGRPAAVTQTHISQFGFGSRQRVSRLLRGLADKGLIEMRYGGVSVPSRARLVAYLADDAPALRDAIFGSRR